MLSKKMIGASVGFGIVLLAFWSACQPKAPKGSLFHQAEIGKEHFDKYCVTCHGEDAKGMFIDSIQGRSADLTTIVDRRGYSDFPVQEIAQFIDGRKEIKAHGSRTMPVWGEKLKIDEGVDSEAELRGKLAEIIAYLMSIQTKAS